MRIMIARPAAIGDTIIITPLIRYLHAQGNEIFMLTSEVGSEIIVNNPHITKLYIHPKNSVPLDGLDKCFLAFKEAWECDQLIDLCESIEVNLSLYPSSPRYKYPLYERKEICDKNFYEETFKRAGLDWGDSKNSIDMDVVTGEMFRPEMFFTPDEEKAMQKFYKPFKDKFVLLWALSGSARCKTYPYVEDTLNMMLGRYNDLVVITVGDAICKILEQPFKDNNRIIKKSGEWSIRESILACKYASCIISPDTGVLHGSGCFDTPKIGLLTHTTIENITKHFTNDYSLEADHDLITCSPCFQLHYVSKVSCNFDIDGYTPVCMKFFDPERITRQIERIRDERYGVVSYR